MSKYKSSLGGIFLIGILIQGRLFEMYHFISEVEFLNLNQIAIAGLYTREAHITVTCEVYDYKIITTIYYMVVNNINATKLHTHHDSIYNEELLNKACSTHQRNLQYH